MKVISIQLALKILQTQQATNYKNSMRSPYTPISMLTLLLATLTLLLIPPTTSQTLIYTVTQQFFTNQFSDDDITGTANPWTITGANVPSYKLFSDCNGVRLFGGYQVFSGDSTNPAGVSKSWSNLPPHYEVTISMKVYKIDSWNSDSFFIQLDTVSQQILTWGSSTGTTDSCGSPTPFVNPLNPQYNEHIEPISLTLPHQSPTLTLKLVSSLKSWTGSWGIRELKIQLKRCQPSCLSCYNATHCSGCDGTNGLTLVGQFCQCIVGGDRRLIQTGCAVTRCVSCIATTCPTGYYNFNTTSCASCSTACATCQGPGSLAPDCLTCNNPAGYIDPGSGVCTICFGFCATCTGLLQNQCTSCQQGSFLLSNQCVTSCPAGFYGSQSQKLCIACTSPCLTCIGSTANHCLSCAANFYLYQTTCSNPCLLSMYGYNGICLSSCPLGTYTDVTTTPLCLPCPNLCDTCDQAGNCITCSLNAYYSPYDNLCYNPCPATYYGDNQTYICTTCDPSCQTCFGPTSGQCSSCPPLTFLVFNTCYSTCPPHTYSLTCQICHEMCMNCTGPNPTDCLTCSKQYMFHLNTSECLIKCYEGDIVDSAAMECLTCVVGHVGYFKKCVRCEATCLTCKGIGFMDCLNCTDSTDFNKNLEYNGHSLHSQQIVYHEKSSTCIYKGTPVIYMPQTKSSNSFIVKFVYFLIWTNLALALLLQIMFKYKTNLLLTIQTMQLVSYLYYFSAPLTESNQILLLFLYHAHPSSIIQTYSIFPSLTRLATIPENTNAAAMFPKAFLMGKTSIFLVDAFYIHVIMFVILIGFVLVRMTRNACRGYAKVNPYLVSYAFRILWMELVLGAIIFFTYIDLTQIIMRWSLVLLVFDILAIAFSFFWKVRTQLQPDHAHYALFYFNQLGTRRQNGRYLQLTERQQKQRKSILPSMINPVSRIPIIITIIIFQNQPLTQSICLLIYSVFLLGIHLAIQYRRRIYRYMTLLTYLGLCVSASMLVAMCCGVDAGAGFDIAIMCIFMGLFLATLGQLVANYQFFLGVFGWVMGYLYAKFGRK